VARSLHQGRSSRHRLDGLASPGTAGLEHAASPNFCRGCSKELTTTPWRLQKFAEHGHWPVRCCVFNAKRAAAFQPAAPAETGGLLSVGGSSPDEAEPPKGAEAELTAEPAVESKWAAVTLGPRQGGEVAGNRVFARR